MQTMQLLRSLSVAVLIAATAGVFTSDISAESAEQRNQRPPAADLNPRTRLDRCATKAVSDDQSATLEQMISAPNSDTGGLVVVPVYWHIITTTKGTGDVSALVPAQMKVLNDAYAGSNFAFDLKGVQVIKNNAWYFSALGSPEEDQMKNTLRKGGPETLNIYTTNGDVYLGWATPAFYYKFFPKYDGVVVWWATLPGTGLAGADPDEPDGILTYDQGDTGTHEVGHWLGLDHTFGPGNGCTQPGDKINDTPTEAFPQFYCAPRNSCTGANFPGDDPITNFMDYVDDVCMDNFTPEQEKRMRKDWHSFRDKKERTK
jgi:hypothetical protein